MTYRLPALLLAAVACLGSGPAQPDISATPETSIEGSWTMVQFNGSPYGPGYFWVIDRQRIRIIVNGKQSLEWNYSTETRGSTRELIIPGCTAIYKVEGDRLLVCFGNGTTRPKDFSGKGPGQSLYDFKRAPSP